MMGRYEVGIDIPSSRAHMTVWPWVPATITPDSVSFSHHSTNPMPEGGTIDISWTIRISRTTLELREESVTVRSNPQFTTVEDMVFQCQRVEAQF